MRLLLWLQFRLKELIIITGLKFTTVTFFMLTMTTYVNYDSIIIGDSIVAGLARYNNNVWKNYF